MCYAILRRLFMALFHVHGRIGTKLFLWFPSIKYYCALQSCKHGMCFTVLFVLYLLTYAHYTVCELLPTVSNAHWVL